MYTALYRAERPEVFEELLGQEHIVKILKHQISSGKINHAYLFCGTRGTGKTTTARILAKAVNCLSQDEEKPCGVCDNCKSISQGTFMDVIEIDAASNNGVDNIRELRESVKYPPSVGKKKVYIIDEVHMLSTGAFNALLKTLEEPPENVIFILATTEPHKLPATILSRCMRLDFKRVPQPTIMAGMERICRDKGVEISKSALTLLSNCADGSVRDGLSILDQVLAGGDKKIDREKVLDYLGTVGEEFFIQLTELVLIKRVSEALILLDEALSDGKDVKQVMKDWLSHYRNLLISKFVKRPEDMLNMSIENIERLKEQSHRISLEELNNGIIRLSKTINDARWSTQPRILLELCIVAIATDLIDEKSLTSTKKKIVEKPEVIEEVKPQVVATKKEDTSLNGQEGQGEDNKEPDVNCMDASQMEELWYDVFEELEDDLGSFNLVRNGSRLISVGQREFVVAVKNNFIQKYAESKRGVIESIISDRVGRNLKMNVKIKANLDDKPLSGQIQKNTNIEEMAKEVSEALGIEIEIK